MRGQACLPKYMDQNSKAAWLIRNVDRVGSLGAPLYRPGEKNCLNVSRGRLLDFYEHANAAMQLRKHLAPNSASYPRIHHGISKVGEPNPAFIVEPTQAVESGRR